MSRIRAAFRGRRGAVLVDFADRLGPRRIRPDPAAEGVDPVPGQAAGDANWSASRCPETARLLTAPAGPAGTTSGSSIAREPAWGSSGSTADRMHTREDSAEEDSPPACARPSRAPRRAGRRRRLAWRRADALRRLLSGTLADPAPGLPTERAAGARIRSPTPTSGERQKEFFIAPWRGPGPDLFVVDRDAQPAQTAQPAPWTVRIYSGESGFKKLAFEISMKKQRSRQFSQGDFWIEVGNRRQPKASVVLITKGETGTGQTEVHVLSGNAGFRRFTLESGTELKDHLGLHRRFIFESERRGGTIYMVRNQDGQPQPRAGTAALSIGDDVSRLRAASRGARAPYWRSR